MLVAPGDCIILRHAYKLLGRHLMGRDMEKSGMIKGYTRTGIEFRVLSCLLYGNQVSCRETYSVLFIQ
jgi:hypothetical protein